MGLDRKRKKFYFYLAVHKMFDQNPLFADFDYNYAHVLIYILFGSLRFRYFSSVLLRVTHLPHGVFV